MSTLKVDTILKRTGTGTITLGQSGDTLAIPSGVTIANSGTATGFGTNSPIFLAYHDGDRDVDNGTETKVIAGTEIIDTDSAYDTSTGRFTVPNGKAGYYKFTAVFTHRDTSNAQTGSGFAFYKNGSKNPFQHSSSQFTGHRNDTRSYSHIFNLAVADYIEFYAFTEGSTNYTKIERPTVMGYKLIT